MTKQWTYTKNEDDFLGSENTIEDYGYNTAQHTRRIADNLEEILSLIKEDMKPKKKQKGDQN